MSNFNKVKTFMETFGQEVKTKPSFSTDKINSLRYDLIKEELEELKEAIALREMDGLSYEEIAEIMQCPIGTVRSRIFRAREAIAEKLKPLIEESNKRW